MQRYERITKEKLEPVIKRCFSFAEVCRHLGKAPVGGNTTHLARLCVKWSIDTSHMTGGAHMRGKRSNRRKDPRERLILGVPTDLRTNPVILTRCLVEEGVEYKCNVCDTVEWRGRPLVLEVDHINSKYWDNRLENLQFICPNCHSQETKYRGRLVE